MKLFSRSLLSALLFVSSVTVASSASAQTVTTPPPAAAAPAAAAGEDARARFATVVAARSITNPKMLLGPFAGLDINSVAGTIGVGLRAGASFAVMDELLVDATILPVTLSPAANYNDPTVGATYRLMNGDLEAGLRAELSLPFSGTFAMRAGGILRYHLDPTTRLDAGALLTVATTPGRVGIQIPVSALHNFTDEIHVGARTGFNIGDFGAASTTMAIPLGVFGAYTIKADTGGPLLDVGPSFDFPLFLTPGGASTVNGNFFTIGLNAAFYIGL